MSYYVHTIAIHTCRYGSSEANNITRYAKIAALLNSSKTVREVALRCRWMSVSPLIVFFTIYMCFDTNFIFIFILVFLLNKNYVLFISVQAVKLFKSSLLMVGIFQNRQASVITSDIYLI